MWEEEAVEDENEDSDYSREEFVVDAAVAIVLAGTSISELVGQNTEPIATRKGLATVGLRDGILDLCKWADIPPDITNLITLYDGLRHFGEAKHEAIETITEARLCECMAAAQRVWQEVMQKQGTAVGDEFRQRFELED